MFVLAVLTWPLLFGHLFLPLWLPSLWFHWPHDLWWRILVLLLLTEAAQCYFLQSSDMGVKQKSELNSRLEEKTNQMAATIKQLEQR